MSLIHNDFQMKTKMYYNVDSFIAIFIAISFGEKIQILSISRKRAQIC